MNVKWGSPPYFTLIEGRGGRLDPESRKPALDPNTLESNVPGLHLAGVIIGGRHTGEIVIENGRFLGKQIIQRPPAGPALAHHYKARSGRPPIPFYAECSASLT